MSSLLSVRRDFLYEMSRSDFIRYSSGVSQGQCFRASCLTRLIGACSSSAVIICDFKLAYIALGLLDDESGSSLINSKLSMIASSLASVSRREKICSFLLGDFWSNFILAVTNRWSEYEQSITLVATIWSLLWRSKSIVVEEEVVELFVLDLRQAMRV